MDLFRSGIKSVLGAPAASNQDHGADTVERLVDRLESSTLLEDRRDACRALKSMSRSYRVEVGTRSMTALVTALQSEAGDPELASCALDTLCNVTSPEALDEEPAQLAAARVGEQFTEIFIKAPDRIPLILSYLEEFEFRVRWPAVKLLTNLLANKPREIQEMVLVSPMGLSKLMDLLSDSREVIRNDVLLLLIQLTKGNANIQKIIAFENAFDRIFDVITDEGLADGGIVVQDCLLLMLNLLRNNSSNMNFFKEGNYIQRLTPLLALPADSENNDLWPAQKIVNTHCVLQVIRALVSPGNPNQILSSSQQIMNSCGLLQALCAILMGSGVPADILTEAINTVAEVIRGSFHNQEYFSSVTAPSVPLRPAIVILLMSMVNEKQPFMLRCAVLYCFQCFLYRNEFAQAQLVQTLRPAPNEITSLSTGQLLCGGMFSSDPLSNWFSAVSLSHGICENTVEKENLLKVLLATSPGSAPVSLLFQCSLLLQQNNRLQCKVGFLMLLSVWLANCPAAVAEFLSMPSNIPFLTAQTGSNEIGDDEELIQGLCAFLMGICIHFNDNSVSSFTKESLSQIVVKRIGLEQFLDKLGSVSKHENYSQAAKNPQIRPRSPQDLLLDHEFCRMFKTLEGLVSKSVSPSEVPDSVIVMQYKDVIREQDLKMQELATELSRLRVNEAALKQRSDAIEGQLNQQRDENVILRACASGDPNSPVEALESARALIQNLQQQVTNLQAEVERFKTADNGDSSNVATLKEDLSGERAAGSRMAAELAHLRGELARLGAELIAEKDRAARAELQIAELEKLRGDQENLLELLADQDLKMSDLKARLRALGEKVDDEDSEEDHSTSVSGS